MASDPIHKNSSDGKYFSQAVGCCRGFGCIIGNSAVSRMSHHCHTFCNEFLPTEQNRRPEYEPTVYAANHPGPVHRDGIFYAPRQVSDRNLVGNPRIPSVGTILRMADRFAGACPAHGDSDRRYRLSYSRFYKKGCRIIGIPDFNFF